MSEGKKESNILEENENPVLMANSDSFKNKSISDLITGLEGDDEKIMLSSLVQLRIRTSDSGNDYMDKIESIIAHKTIFNTLMDMLEHENTVVQFQTAWLLTNLAVSDVGTMHMCRDLDLIKKFCDILKKRTANKDMLEQCAWAVGNLAGDNTESRDVILKNDGLKICCDLLECTSNNKPVYSTETFSWVVSNLLRRKPSPSINILKEGIPVLGKLLLRACKEGSQWNKESISNLCWAFSYITDNDEVISKAMVPQTVIGCLVQLMTAQPLLSQPATRAIGNFASGDDTTVDKLLQCGLLNVCIGLFDSPKISIRKEICWTVSNITAGTAQQVKMVESQGIFEIACRLVDDANVGVSKEAGWILLNACSSNAKLEVSSMKCCILGCCKIIDREMDSGSKTSQFPMAFKIINQLVNRRNFPNGLPEEVKEELSSLLNEAEGKIDNEEQNEEIMVRINSIQEFLGNEASPSGGEGAFQFDASSPAAAADAFNFF